MAVSTILAYNVPANFTYDTTKIDLSSGAAQLLSPYNTGNPAIMSTNPVDMVALSGFSDSVVASGSDAVKYIINIAGTDYYWNGVAWAASDASYAKTNTAAEIQAHCGHASLTALLAGGQHVYVKALLHSNDGSTTPVLTSVTLTYTFFAIKPADPATCLVYLWLKDIADLDITSVQNAKLSATNLKAYQYGSFCVLPFNKEVDFDLTGYAAITLMETTTPGIPIVFGLTYTQGKTTKQIKFIPCLVPNTGAAALSSITVPSDGNSLGIAPVSAVGPPGPPGLPPYVDIPQTAFTIVNNQVTPLDLTGLVFNKLTTRSAVIDMWCYRNTTAPSVVSLMEHRQMLATYRQDTDDWDLTPVFRGPDDSGLTFSITAAGQVQYISSNLTGTPANSKGIFAARTFNI